MKSSSLLYLLSNSISKDEIEIGSNLKPSQVQSGTPEVDTNNKCLLHCVLNKCGAQKAFR